MKTMISVTPSKVVFLLKRSLRLVVDPVLSFSFRGKYGNILIRLMSSLDIENRPSPAASSIQPDGTLV
jgi:hypothetical protein